MPMQLPGWSEPGPQGRNGLGPTWQDQISARPRSSARNACWRRNSVNFSGRVAVPPRRLAWFGAERL